MTLSLNDLSPAQNSIYHYAIDPSLTQVIVITGRRAGKDALTQLIAQQLAKTQSTLVISPTAHQAGLLREIKNPPFTICSASAFASYNAPYHTILFNEVNYDLFPPLYMTAKIRAKKIIIITNPTTNGDFFHKLSTETSDTHKVISEPSWRMNPSFSKENLKKEFAFFNENEFLHEFGARFNAPPETQTVSLRFPAGQLDALKAVARLYAARHNKDVTYTDFIRDAVSEKIHQLHIEIADQLQQAQRGLTNPDS